VMRNYTAHAIQSGLRPSHAVLLSGYVGDYDAIINMGGLAAEPGPRKVARATQGVPTGLFGFSRQLRLMTFHEDAAGVGPGGRSVRPACSRGRR
jgi:hypothetical protein